MRAYCIISLGVAFFLLVFDSTEGCTSRKLKFDPDPMKGQRLLNHVIDSKQAESETWCRWFCLWDDNCVSINYNDTEDSDKQHFCELNNSDGKQHPDDLKKEKDFTHQGTENPCSDSPCGVNGLCQTGFGIQGYRCVCKAGYSGQACEKDINECDKSKPCHPNAKCTNTPGSYKCKCNAGYEGNGKQCAESVRGSKENPGYSCEDILRATQGHAENGIFWIKFSWETDPFQVYCDMKSGGYTLAFKMVSGNNQDVLAAYNSTPPVNEHVVDAMNITNKFKGHYKNRIVLDANWKKFNSSYVKVVLYTGGVEKLAMKFDGKLSNYLNWFTERRLLSSPYTDVKTEPKNFFSVLGHGAPKRFFFINRMYGYCPEDAGWFVTSGDTCYWETRFPYPTVIYSKLKTYTNWNVNGNVSSAEVMAVYVQ